MLAEDAQGWEEVDMGPKESPVACTFRSRMFVAKMRSKML